MPILPGPPAIEITLRRSARSTRFSLRVSRLDGRVTLSMPKRARETEALRFAREQEAWIRDALAAIPERQSLGFGAVIPVEGVGLQLVNGTGRSIRREGGQLLVPGAEAQLGPRLQAFLKVLARDRLVAACDAYAGQLGLSYSRITLRDTRSRWGSCAHDGALMFSWRLIMAPPSVLRYVAAHEVAHLAEMNHSPAFWAVVERLYPNWQGERAWLHGEGGKVHQFRFDPAPEGIDPAANRRLG